MRSSWPAVAQGDHYTIERSASVKADAGFSAITALRATTGDDRGALTASDSYPYQVVAVDCAGASSDPP